MVWCLKQLICCCLVAEIAQLEEEVKEMELRIEKEKEEHKELMEQKAKEYVETEQELIAANQEISTVVIS